MPSCWEGALRDCDDDEECQGELICGRAYDPGAEGWVCEGERQLPNQMCRQANTPPDALCKNFVASADGSCQYALQLSDVDNGSNDPDQATFGNPIVMLSPPVGTLLSPGSTAVTLTITDADGEADSCPATVTVNDDTPPTITCPENILVYTDSGKVSAVVEYVAPIGTDNCPSSTVLSRWSWS